MSKLTLTFSFVNTEVEAQKMCEEYNKKYSWRKRKARYANWESADGKEKKFTVFYEH